VWSALRADVRDVDHRRAWPAWRHPGNPVSRRAVPTGPMSRDLERATTVVTG
jgi:hypothetical protein